MRIIIALLFSYSLCVIGDNVLKNPSFENGFDGYMYESNGCSISNKYAKDGSKSLYCKTSTAGPYQHLTNIPTGLYYEISGYIRMNGCTGRVLLSFESKNDNYLSTAYAYSTSNEKCKNNNCFDDWYNISAESLTPIKPAEHYSFAITVRDKGSCEFYLDSLSLKPIFKDILRSVEIQAWRHEVYKEKVLVFVDLLIKDTIYEKGENMDIYIEMIDEETKSTKLKLTNWKIVKREENYVAQFELDPSKLKPGYYDAKATVINKLAKNKVETASTSFHVLDKKRDYGIYVDKYLRVIDHGKPFFPLGIMCGDCKHEYFTKYFIDSPFNLVEISGKHTNEQITKFYEEGNRQLRIIDRGVQKFLNYDINDKDATKKIHEQLIEYVNNIKDNPGLFGFYSANENGVKDIPKLKANTRVIREVDYDHPLYGIYNLRRYMHLYKETVDCYGTDIYPGDNFEKLHYVYIVTREGRDRVVNNLANWGVPQFFDLTIDGRPNESPPNKEQMYQTMYQMLVGGANGIVWFDFHEMTKSPKDWRPYWEDLKDIMRNFKKKFVPIFLSINAPDPGYDKSRIWFNEINTGRPCGLRFFRFNKADYILAVNPYRSDNTQCVFDIPKSAKDFKILEGKSRMTINGTTITLEMPKMDVTWLQANNKGYSYKEELYEKGYFDNESNKGTIAGVVVLLIMTIFCVAIVGLIIYFKKKGKNNMKESPSS